MSASKTRLDQTLLTRGLVRSRSQAESYTKLGYVTINGQVITKPSFLVSDQDALQVTADQQYVSRAGLKLASVAELLDVDFRDKVILDVGSSTGGFTDYVLKHGAKKVIAVEVGTDQLHPTLHAHPRIELHEKTDIRGFQTSETIDVVVMDLSFISLREVLPHVASIIGPATVVIAMVKPQFEAPDSLKHKGVIKNDKIRRNILNSFEIWTQKLFVIREKADSAVAGAKGNQERFYKLQLRQNKP